MQEMGRTSEEAGTSLPGADINISCINTIVAHSRQDGSFSLGANFGHNQSHPIAIMPSENVAKF